MFVAKRQTNKRASQNLFNATKKTAIDMKCARFAEILSLQKKENVGCCRFYNKQLQNIIINCTISNVRKETEHLMLDDMIVIRH